MGKLIWSQWAKLIALTCGVFQVIGGIFGLFYRIPMFGTMTHIYDQLINPTNILAITAIPLGVMVISIEWPLFLFKDTFLTASYMPRIIFYLINSAITVFNYQTADTAVFLLVATTMYTAAMAKNENRKMNLNVRGQRVV